MRPRAMFRKQVIRLFTAIWRQCNLYKISEEVIVNVET